MSSAWNESELPCCLGFARVLGSRCCLWCSEQGTFSEPCLMSNLSRGRGGGQARTIHDNMLLCAWTCGKKSFRNFVWSQLQSLCVHVPTGLFCLQANLLLQDHAQRIHLQNGLVVELNVQGVVSMDLSGLVSISLWHKNCKSLIKNRCVDRILHCKRRKMY